jgi:hypothetical protein
MSGGSGYGIVILYIGSFALGLTGLVVGAFWYWLLPLWQSVLAAFGVGIALVIAWFSALGYIQKRNFSSVLREINVGIWICAWLVGGVGGILWLVSSVSLLAIIVFLVALLALWGINSAARISIKWNLGFFLLATLCGIFAKDYFLEFSLGSLLLFLGLNVGIRHSLGVYLAIVKYPSLYRWFEKDLTVKQLNYIFKQQPESGKNEFINHYLSNFIHNYGDHSVSISVNKEYDLVFWDLLAKGETKLSEQYSNTGYAPTLLAFNFEFMKKWLKHANQHPCSMEDIKMFGENCQEFISIFIETPEYYSSQAYKTKGLEQSIDNILTHIPYSWESLSIAYGLVYTAIGIAKHLEEPEY